MSCVKGCQEAKLYSSKYREDSLAKERKEKKEGKLAKGEYICTRITKRYDRTKARALCLMEA